MTDSKDSIVENMLDSEKTLFQVRISPAERRQIKMLAASQGVTLHKALIEAFAAWAEKLHAGDGSPQPQQPKPPQNRRPARTRARHKPNSPALPRGSGVVKTVSQLPVQRNTQPARCTQGSVSAAAW